MDKNEKKQVKNPRQGANILSIITFKWLFGTFYEGYKRELEVDDLYSALNEHSSRYLGNKTSRLWKKELEKCEKTKKKSSPSLLKVLIKCFGCDFMVCGIFFAIVEFVIRIYQPHILAELLKYFAKDSKMSREQAFYWGAILVLGQFFVTAINAPVLQGLMHIGMKMRVACCSLIYRKMLKVSKVAIESETGVGQMINLLSNDVNRLDYSCLTVHYIWIGPLQTIIVAYLIYTEVEKAAIAGICALLIFLPIHGWYGKIVSKLTKKFSYTTDERLSLTNEIINGVKVIKMYAWEKPFSYLVDNARWREAKVIKNNLMVTELCWSFEGFIPRICIFITILSYITWAGKDINAGTAYIITSYYNVLRTTLFRTLPLSIRELAEALVSMKRLEKFLTYDEIQPKPITNNYISPEDQNIAISLKNISIKWRSESETEALKQISFQIKSGSLNAVIGQVGAGKSTLLYAILNEITPTQGELKVNGKISYASQEAWLFTSNVKQNILFGQPMNKERYDKVIEVCQLKRDFEQLPYGDNTLVGEKGINLSGGQRARINLARAVYRQADIYLLDDPLSAVDTHVGRGMFEECIKTFLNGKTVILITHQFHHLRNVDNIIILDGGKLQAQGTYNELLSSDSEFANMMKHENESDDIIDEIEPEVNVKLKAVKETVTVNEEEEEEEAESRTVGQISLRTYLEYFGATKSVILVFLVVVTSIICQIPPTGADYFVSLWVNWEEENGNKTSSESDDAFRGRSWFIIVYGGLIILTVIVTIAQIYTFFEMCMKISRNLHAMMFNSIIKTSMAFFNANPIGRIMNRFSKDMGVVDTRLPQTIIDVSQIALYVAVTMAMVGRQNPYFLIAAFVLGVVAYYIRSFYIKTGRSVKRLEGITRSPVFNHLTASVYGLTTIRALGAQSILTKEFDSHQDLHSSAWFIFISGSRAFGLYVELLCIIFIGTLVYGLTILKDSTMAGDVGFLVTECMLVTQLLQWGVKQTTELENQMTSVERVLEYTKLPPEPKLESSPDTNAPDNWPAKGEIIFKDVSLTYDRQEKPALRNLNITIEPNQMIGIVGRTGAGKSSIINAVFRLADIEGDIYIDGIASSQISLHDLRSKISIIPQEPVLFAGTLRKNLDPLEEYTDHELFQVLEDIELKPLLESDLGLDSPVIEGGTNFSVGQRQLLCLARAIVRNNKILILDEATANVDPYTDELIQKAVRKKFKNCTVLIIAHRLNTVMDSDKILVMDAGQIVEFDHPYNLLQNEDGVFYNMVQQTGASGADNLLEVARASYENKFSDNIHL